jgi:hypothetical protein
METRKIIRCLAFSSAEAESAFSLMHNPVIYRRNALLIENISHLMMVKLLAKPLMDGM